MRAGAALGGISVGAGAYGAHALKAEPKWLNVWKVGVQYQQVGACALMAAAAHPSPRARLVGGGTLLAGTCLFSGTNFVVSLMGENTFGKGAPLGGLLMIGGFFGLAIL